MSKYILFLTCLLCSILSLAQTQTEGVSGLPVVVNLSDSQEPDFFPSLINLSQHIIPSAEYGNRKIELNILRDEFERRHPIDFSNQSKTRNSLLNPSIVKSFQGNTSSSIPNDNDIAVSNDGKVVSVVNSNIRVYNDTGKIINTRSLTSVFNSVGTFSWISDPRVLYDPKADRFVLVCFSGSLSTESKILVAFSASNDPSLSWNCYTLNGASFNDSTWSDYPIIALTDKDLFMTFNQVKDNVSWTIGFKQSVIWQISKEEGYQAQPLQYTLWSDIKYNGGYLRNICPAKYQNANMGNNMYFLTLRNVASSNDSIFVTEITDSKASGKAKLKQRLLISPVKYGFPPNARMKKPAVGSRQYLMTNDARVLAAVYENDYIHFGSNTLNPEFMNAGVYLGTIKNISSEFPMVSADILSSATVEYGYPSMTYLDRDHKLMYTFSHCYVDSFPGTSVLYKNGSDQYSDVIALKNGTSIINVLGDSIERWGDYTNIQKMYNNPNRTYMSGLWGFGSGMNCWIGMVDNQDESISQVKASETKVYPNPIWDDRVKIHFTLDKAQKVYFNVYDVQGRLVAKVLNNFLNPGDHIFSFSITQLNKGYYYLKIIGDNKTLGTHKLKVE